MKPSLLFQVYLDMDLPYDVKKNCGFLYWLKRFAVISFMIVMFPQSLILLQIHSFSMLSLIDSFVSGTVIGIGMIMIKTHLLFFNV
jgi:hypothetical protein